MSTPVCGLVVGYAFARTLRNPVHLGLGLGEVHTPLEPGHGRASRSRVIFLRESAGPQSAASDLELTARVLKVRPHHTHDGVREAAQVDGLSNDGAIRAEAAPPQAVTQHRDGVSSRSRPLPR